MLRGRVKPRLFPAWAFLTTIAGCGFVPPLPDSFDVATSASVRTSTDAGTGSPSFINSVWSLNRKPEPTTADAEIDASATPRGPYGGLLNGQGLERPPVGERIFLVRFGSAGEMVEVSENRYFLSKIYGSTVPVGGEWTGTVLPGVSFNSETYGLEADGRFGVATVVNVRFSGFFLGRAILYSWGTIVVDRIDGQFGYLLDFTEGIVSFLQTVADQYPVEGQRISP